MQFVSNGVAFTGQMLLPIYLIRACAQSPGGVGLLLAPLGVGMMCVYPATGWLTKRFGIRHVSFGGGLVALLGTLPLAYLGSHGLVVGAFVLALFVRGAGMGAVGVPAVSAAYASVPRGDLPMASTAVNIVQRLGGPVMTTLMSTFLGWRSRSVHGPAASHGVFMQAFLLLAAGQAILALAAMRLPRVLDREGESATA